MSNGLILGHTDGKASILLGIKSLFNSSISDKAACQRFVQAFQRKQPKRLVRLTKAVHTAIFAPTGVGKGVSCIMPFMFTCPESCVVVDFKGEIYRLTADARRRMGHKVVCIDLFNEVTQRSDTFNALDFIDKTSRHAIDECNDLAEALVVRTGEEKEPHWNDSAEMWIAAMTACVVCFGNDGDKNLQSVRALLADPVKAQSAIKEMCESTAWEGMLARLAQQLGHFVDRERGSVLTNANRHMRFLDTLAVADKCSPTRIATCVSSTPWRLLTTRKKAASIRRTCSRAR
jgi:type IV secretion system protein VirD4